MFGPLIIHRAIIFNLGYMELTLIAFFFFIRYYFIKPAYFNIIVFLLCCVFPTAKMFGSKNCTALF